MSSQNNNINDNNSNLNNQQSSSISTNNIIEQEQSHSSLISNLSKNPSNIRNLCVLAHVDHGKTSLVDNLISYNNIISPRMAGDVRYMDSRPDEQERCITMKSSSISIAYHSLKFNENYLMNMIDSPGHVDFNYEIFSALKIVDGAIIVIDVIEGICSQTESVIRQAWDEKIKCILVLNKIDKLFTTVNLSPLEAYEHLFNLMEKVNALMSSLILRDLEINKNSSKSLSLSKENNSSNNNLNNNINNEVNIDNIIEEKENEVFFDPCKGNVIFASALDNWAFTLETFADILIEKFKFKKESLMKVLWGEYYFNNKNKKIYNEPINENSKPIFVDFILNNIYKIYDTILNKKDIEKIKNISKSLKIEITNKELNTNNLNKNPNLILKTIMRQWLPIPTTIFDVAIQHLPNPIVGIQNKIDLLFPNVKFNHNNFVKDLKFNIKKGNILNAPTLAYISKMIPISKKNITYLDDLNINNNNIIYNLNNNNNINEDDIIFMPFARLFTGTLTKNSEYYVIGPKHDPQNNKYDITKFKFDNFFYFMGQYLSPIPSIFPGSIFSVLNLENEIFKTGTISSIFECPSIIPLNLNKNSNIKVSITTENLKDIPLLVNGLKKLNRSDPACEYYIQKNGEHILVTSGEVHLERCIKDLEETLAKVKIVCSEPIVNFKEGLANKNYFFKKKIYNKNIEIQKNIEEIKETKLRERKMNNDLDEYYIVEDGEENIDFEDEKDVMKSSTPMVLKKAEPIKKLPVIAKHKVKDVIEKNEKKTSNFIEKQNLISNYVKNQNKNILNQKGFSEGEISSGKIKLGITAFGLNEDVVDLIENNQKFIEIVENNNFEVDKETFREIFKFKEELENKIENKKILKIIKNYLYEFGTKEGKVNLFLIKHLEKEQRFFDRIKCIDEDFNEEYKNLINNDKIILSEKNNNNNNENNKKKFISDELEKFLNKKNISLKEFMISLKVGFDLAVKNGPLCEENMYGVVFVLEFIELKKNEDESVNSKKEEEKNNNENVIKDNNMEILKEEQNNNNNNEINTIKSNINEINNNNNINNNNIISNETNNNNKEEEPSSPKQSLKNDLSPNNITPSTNTNNNTPSKSSAKNNNNNSINISNSNNNNNNENKSSTSNSKTLYNSFLGQIISLVKDTCRKSYLCADPRLYEALYLCTFQLNQENVGKIHSVINKRRGEIINEIPSDENIKCTIEAIVPVVESFGFVEEIRKKSSGLTNPMLGFYKWKILDIDPFDMPTEEDIINYGVNVDTPNKAKNYINKIRRRKGLLTDEKIVKGADKQRNIAKKR